MICIFSPVGPNLYSGALITVSLRLHAVNYFWAVRQKGRLWLYFVMNSGVKSTGESAVIRVLILVTDRPRQQVCTSQSTTARGSQWFSPQPLQTQYAALVSTHQLFVALSGGGYGIQKHFCTAPCTTP